MNVIDRLRLFSDGRTSMHDARALIMSMGYSQEEFNEALGVLVEEAGSSIRVGKATVDELQSDIYLIAS